MPRAVTLRPTVAQHLALVGAIVTVDDRQFRVHAVEGRDWYAFCQDGDIIVDPILNPPAVYITEPECTLLPMGAALGSGLSQTVTVDKIKRGVCLVKP